jgi:hypothetical protein
MHHPQSNPIHMDKEGGKFHVCPLWQTYRPKLAPSTQLKCTNISGMFAEMRWSESVLQFPLEAE